MTDQIVKDQHGWFAMRLKEHQVGLEPTLPHYECGVLAAGRPVLD